MSDDRICQEVGCCEVVVRLLFQSVLHVRHVHLTCFLKVAAQIVSSRSTSASVLGQGVHIISICDIIISLNRYNVCNRINVTTIEANGS